MTARPDIKRRRLALGWTMRQAAEVAGINAGTWSLYERGLGQCKRLTTVCIEGALARGERKAAE